ncbi:MAG: hypothetical protein GY841_15040 [FCB group bacterium]|nr:hypothetical protein [FCB group bacterium]
MKIPRSWLTLLIFLVFCAGFVETKGRGRIEAQKETITSVSTAESADVLPSQLRPVAVHDAGDYYTVISDGLFSSGMLPWNRDPETDRPLYFTNYPQGRGANYTFTGAMWVGGIIGEDTIVSMSADGWFFGMDEFRPIDIEEGGIYRTGRFADDEFVMVMVDTGIAGNTVDPPRELGIKVTQTSYSWADTLYDDFVIFKYNIENIGQHNIRDGCVGFYFDHDIYQVSQAINGYADDCSALLDTLLYDEDPASRTRISYSFDNDGDPLIDSGWTDGSIRGVISMRLLAHEFDAPYENFNWWQSHGSAAIDFGPRRVGTTADPLRLFASGNLGTAITDGDRYYLMVHPEVDYPTLETAVHDSTDGWIAPSELMGYNYADGLDTRYMHSFGSFDLAPGESVSFAMVRAGARRFHVDPNDYDNYYDADAPGLYQDHFDYTDLMINHRRADSVYKSGMMLPRPGAPVGLRIAAYDDSFVDLIWQSGMRIDLAGFHLYIKDTLLDDRWRRVFSSMLTDTTATCPIMSPNHEYQLAISLVDGFGRESSLSFPVFIVPGIPHPPENLAAELDGLIPKLSWTPPVDTALLAYMIYRSIWDGGFELHDSTTALSYHDYDTESGHQYKYKVSAKNDLDRESEMVGPVMAIPMAMNQGALFINHNVDHPSNLIAYQTQSLDQLYESLAALIPIERMDINYGLEFKDLADHSPVIMDAESRNSNPWWPTTDWLGYYLSGGGKVIFVLLSGATTSISGSEPTVNRFSEGDFFHDYLKLDSSVTNAMIINYQDTAVIGDLNGCRSVHPQYASITTDTEKFGGPVFDVKGGLPMSGYLFPTADAEQVYTYMSVDPDTSHHRQVNAIRYLGDDYSFVMFNFALSMMKEPGNHYVLRQAMIDLGVQMECGDIIEDGRNTLGDIIYLVNYLYRNGDKPPVFENADVNCDNEIDLADIITLINFLMRQESWLKCCP